MKYKLLNVLLFPLLFACNNKVNYEYPTQKMLSYAVEYVANDINDFATFDYELCGHFSHAWKDSTLIASIKSEKLDSIFSEDDLEYVISQYSNMDYMDVPGYMPNINNYKLENNQEKHLDVHYCISPPLYTISKRSWVVFVEVFTRNGYDAYFMVYSIDPEKKQISSVLYSNEHVKKPNIKEHKHVFWLNFSK